MERDNVWWKTGRVVVLGGFLAFAIFPLYWIVITSLKGQQEIFALPIRYWPESATLLNYIEIFRISHFQVYIWNSFLVSLVASSVVVLIAMLGGYVLARFSFRGKRQVMLGFLLTQMIPMFIGMAPLYVMMSRMHILNSLVSLMLVYTVMLIPFCTIIMSGFFQRIPNALEEAAMIDGCSRTHALFRVIVPVMLPGIAATFIFAFVHGGLVHRRGVRQDDPSRHECFHQKVRHRVGGHVGSHRAVCDPDHAAVRLLREIPSGGADTGGCKRVGTEKSTILFTEDVLFLIFILLLGQLDPNDGFFLNRLFFQLDNAPVWRKRRMYVSECVIRQTDLIQRRFLYLIICFGSQSKAFVQQELDTVDRREFDLIALTNGCFQCEWILLGKLEQIAEIVAAALDICEGLTIVSTQLVDDFFIDKTVGTSRLQQHHFPL